VRDRFVLTWHRAEDAEARKKYLDDDRNREQRDQNPVKPRRSLPN
jgi:hypothetical protein